MTERLPEWFWTPTSVDGSADPQLWIATEPVKSMSDSQVPLIGALLLYTTPDQINTCQACGHRTSRPEMRGFPYPLLVVGI